MRERRCRSDEGLDIGIGISVHGGSLGNRASHPDFEEYIFNVKGKDLL